MNDNTILLGEREDKPLIRIIVIIFGIMCVFTAGWWAIYLIKYPDSEKIFWAGSIFLLLFGIYQVYAGLGFAKRYIKKENNNLIIRQSSLLPPKNIKAQDISSLVIRTYDIVINLANNSRIRIKPGLKYPEQGQKVINLITDYAKENNIEVSYKNESL